jgi:ADP-ribose pyrophosphatase YjhB (NUDIX family)
MSQKTIRYKTARCILYKDDRYLLAVHNRFWAGSRRWGLPGGQIEWGESPLRAAARELEEELAVYLPDLMEVGAFTYKRAMHMVFAAPLAGDVESFDDAELLDIGWFTEREIATLKSRESLHADYELEAVRQLRARLGGTEAAAGM